MLKRNIRFTLAGFMLCFLAGCANLAAMKTVALVEINQQDKALVNIVRPSIFLGDGVDFEVWDGDKFVGTLESGTMIQYHATPGEHLFMIDPVQSGWGYKKITLEAGQTYYIKPNTIPFARLQIGLAQSDDRRIPKWNRSLTPVAIDTTKSKAVPAKNIEEAKRYVKQFTQG